jgi:hypothetical protein
MKKTALQICSLLGLVVVILMIAVSAKAQTQYRAHIPFDFTIGQKSYEAGDYVIDSLSIHAAYGPVAFRDAKGRNSRMVMTTRGEDSSKVEAASLVFIRYESQYSLSVIRTPSFIVQLPKPKAKETLAQNQIGQQKIVVLAKKN